MTLTKDTIHKLPKAVWVSLRLQGDFLLDLVQKKLIVEGTAAKNAASKLSPLLKTEHNADVG